MTDDLTQYPLTGRFLRGRLRHAMTDAEKAHLESLVSRTESFDGIHRIVRRGAVCNHSTVVIDGFLMRTMEENDRRFVVGLHVPGDFADLHCFALKKLDHDVVTIGPTRVGYVEHSQLQELMATEPHLARLLWFSTLLDASIHRQWILKLQQLKASGRVAHLFSELWRRLDLVGMARPDGFQTPLTQADLADMCGTTAIHMNRALGELKRARIAEFRRGRVFVKDRDALERYADFNPDYLYSQGELAIERELDFA